MAGKVFQVKKTGNEELSIIYRQFLSETADVKKYNLTTQQLMLTQIFLQFVHQNKILEAVKNGLSVDVRKDLEFQIKKSKIELDRAQEENARLTKTILNLETEAKMLREAKEISEREAKKSRQENSSLMSEVNLLKLKIESRITKIDEEND